MRYTSLQFFRGIAALGVVLHHASVSTNAIVAPLPPWLDAIMSRGYLGVDFFFVLSGFIILNAHLGDAKTATALRNYARKRFLRIFPPYWPIGMAMLITYVAAPGVSLASRDISTFSSLTLLPAAGAPALSVAWTLIHEVLFYVIFAAFFVSPRLLAGLVAIWAVLILTVEPIGPWSQRLLSPLNFEFMMGMGVAMISYRRHGAAVLATGVLAFAAVVALPFESRFLTGVSFAVIVWGGVALRSAVRFPTAMGDASYALYLVHNPVISATSRIARLYPSWWTGLLGIPVAVLAGLAYHRFVEKPAIRAWRWMLQARRPAPV